MIHELVEEQHEHGGGSRNAAIMIWLGILIDAVPESLVIGILSNSGENGSKITFVIGVFLANFPEAMSSSGTMKACGIHGGKIILMWALVFVLTGVGAAIGSVFFPPGSEDSTTNQFLIAGVEGACGGAMLTMIANTVLPEALEQGGSVVGLSCLGGFLSALAVKSLANKI